MIAPRHLDQRGLSMIELLVALALGSFITVGIVQMFTANRETYALNIGQARMQESARFAVNFLSRPARMAGFSGCISDSSEMLNVLNPETGAKPYEFDLSESIAGHEATATDTWSPALGALPDDVEAIGPQSGTDILTIRAVSADGVRLSANMPSSSAVIKTTHPDSLDNFEDGDVLIISDCEKSAVFQITNSQTISGGTELNIVHNAGGGASPGNHQKELTDDGSSFDTSAAVYSVQTSVFFVAPGAGTNNAGDTPLSLWRKFGTDAPVELVEGIENLQLRYGVDTDGDGVPNRYRTIQTIADTRDIVSVHLQITANSGDVVTDTGDGLLRRTFTKTIALRNTRRN